MGTSEATVTFLLFCSSASHFSSLRRHFLLFYSLFSPLKHFKRRRFRFRVSSFHSDLLFILQRVKLWPYSRPCASEELLFPFAPPISPTIKTQGSFIYPIMFSCIFFFLLGIYLSVKDYVLELF